MAFKEFDSCQTFPLNKRPPDFVYSGNKSNSVLNKYMK
jgi:hypothetical protein